MISAATAATKEPAKKYIPHIVEYQWGSRDMIQSMPANVIVRLKRMIAGPAAIWSLWVVRGSPVASWRSDWPENQRARMAQTAK